MNAMGCFEKQQPTKQQQYGHLHPISQITQVKRITHTGHCWERKDELKSDVLLWTSTQGHTSVDLPAKTDIHQFCADTGYILGDLLRAMDDRDG